MGILDVSGLTKKFGGLTAVDGIDLNIEQGEIRGLIGPNGSGKTTLLNLISGFLRPTGGKIIWKGHDVTNLPAHVKARRGIARTFQLTTLFEDMTVLENVVIGCYLHNNWSPVGETFGTAAARKNMKLLEEKALGFLELMGAVQVKDRLAKELPHGYQRLLGIAIALAVEPELILLDEPVTGMNPTEIEEAMNRVKMLRNKGITIMLIEHHMKAVMTTCDRITVINFGKKIAEGTPAEITRDKNVVEAYLGDEEVYV